MEHRLYTISVTKAEVEWVLNKSETEVKIDMMESSLMQYKEGEEVRMATLKRLLLTLGYDPNDEKTKYEIFNDAWWIEFEERFKER
jgi:hypothetical protein